MQGLVNFRTQSSSPYSSQKTKAQTCNDQRGQRTGTTAENIVQMDVEHMGLMS